MRFRMQHSRIHALAAVLCLAFSVLPFPCGASCCASGAEPSIDLIELGFGGLGRVGHRIPVRLHAEGLPDGEELRAVVTVPDPRGNLCAQEIAKGQAEGGRIELLGSVAIGRLEGQLQIEIENEAGERLCETTARIVERRSVAEFNRTENSDFGSAEANQIMLVRQSTTCVLTIGELAGIEEMEQLIGDDQGEGLRLQWCVLKDASQFPISLEALESVDHIVLEGSTRLSDRQTSVLKGWVKTGGHLILTAGSTVGEMLETELGKWIQPVFLFLFFFFSIFDFFALQNFVPGAVSLSTQRRTVSMARATSDQLRSIVLSLDGPLVSRAGIGAGRVTFVAVELNQRPLSNWDSLPRLYELLVFNRVLDNVSVVKSSSRRISSSGVSDLGTQLAATWDAVPPEQRWSSWQIMALMFVYMLIIGPLDYFIVTRLLKRAHLTWLTFPVMVATGCGLIYAQTGPDTASQTSRQIHVVDVSQEHDRQQTIHVRSWVSLSSHVTQRADVAAVQNRDQSWTTNTAAVDINWQGRAEDVYGGMYRAGGAGLGRQTYRVLSELHASSDEKTDLLTERRIVGLPMLAGGSQAVAAEWFVETDGSGLFNSKLTASGTGLLDGEVTLNLPVAISDWLIFYGNRVYQPGFDALDEQRVIQPNSVWRREPWVRASDLKTFLNGVRIIASRKPGSTQSEARQVTTPYNPASRNPLEILTMISLFDIAGGEAYCGVSNHSLQHMEVSENIRINTALLIGRIDAPPTSFLVDGEAVTSSESGSIVRLLMPVKRRAAEEQAATTLEEALLEKSND
ncbi:MAG: hypothetical protein KDA91_05120 [Planctomycetaceae bacterium]|nr:hypothetical protein [Planctomycetaceae bacterium]